jgi:hypothetical protein
MSYLITQSSKKDLRFARGRWVLPEGPERFQSLRTARVYLKKNYGRLNVAITVYVPGLIRAVQVQGTIR